jgi:hypothetical protein
LSNASVACLEAVFKLLASPVNLTLIFSSIAHLFLL